MLHRTQNDLHFRHVTALLRRRWPLILATGLLGGGLAAAAGWLMVPTYTAKAQLLHEWDPGDGVVTDVAAVDTMVEMLMSPSHLGRLADSLQQDALAPPPVAAEPEDPAIATVVYPPADLSYEAIAEGLSAYKERQSRLVAVTFTATDPQAAALVANRSAELFLEVEANYQREKRARALRVTAERIPEARAKLDQAEHALRAHRVEYGLMDATETDGTDQQIADLNRHLMLARSELEALRSQVNRVRADAPGEEGRDAPLAGSDEALVVTAAGPGRAASDGEPPQTMPAEAVARMIADRDAVEARIRDIEGRLVTLRQASSASTDSWTRFSELQREVSAAGQAYENLLRRYDDLLGQNAVRPSARIVTMASAPDQPSSPSPLLFVAPAIVASLLAGGVLAVVLERLDQRLRTEQDAEAALGAPCIGSVPRVRRLKGATLVRLLHEEPFAPYTEAIRGVFVAATRLAPRTKSSSVILVTSCAGGEGKTTLLASLAIYAARLGRPVLVIDLDFRNPGLLGVIAGSEKDEPIAAPELVAALALPADLRIARQAGVDYVVLPKSRVDPLSILYRDDFTETLSRLRESYEYILIKSGPVLAANETVLLSSMVDHVILALRWGVTDARDAHSSAQQLRAAGADFSVVMNQVKPGRWRQRYREPVAPVPVPVRS